ncbi:MAG TPA: hypothetical protein VEH27_03185 [Methylomirabilota bacterium]|nr:hypothetical protein [Methylomirabilota bacterium]
MSDQEQSPELRDFLARAALRKRWQQGLRGLWIGLAIGAAAWLLVYAIYKITPIPESALLAAGIVALASAVAGLIAGFWRKPTLSEAARWLDYKENLKERLTTALEASSKTTTVWTELLVREAKEAMKTIELRRSMPFTLPKAAQWTAILLVGAFVLNFVPEYRTQAYVAKKKDEKVIKETGQQVASFTKKNLDRRPPALPDTQKALEQALQAGEHLAKAELTRAEALKDLANAADKLKQEAKELGSSPTVKALQDAARSPQTGGSPANPELQKQIDQLQEQLGSKFAGNSDSLQKLKSELQQARDSAEGLKDATAGAAEALKKQLEQKLADIARQAAEMELPMEALQQAIQALANNKVDEVLKDLAMAELDLEKLQQMAKALEQLQKGQPIGKDLAEQLERGQASAAKERLEKMASDLKNGNLTPEQAQEMLAELKKALPPASQYGKVGEELKKAAANLEKGQKNEAAENMMAAAQGLSEAMQQLGDMEGMLATLEALQQAQWAIANGQAWSEAGASMAEMLGQMAGRSRNNRGAGGWTEDDSWEYPEFAESWDNSGLEREDQGARGQKDRGEPALADNLSPTRLKGQMRPGGPMPSITLKGVSIKGTSKVGYTDASPGAQSADESALNQDQIPRAYQGAVRDYFDDTKE